MIVKPFHETTSADNKSIGFDYQFYYFLYLLLQLKAGEVIGYEVMDDIHIELDGGKVVLIQSKHSIGSKEKNEVGNLTERDKDLWKTISNWIEHINDKGSNRGIHNSQIAYLKQLQLILVANKKYSENNIFLSKISLLKNREITIIDFRNYLTELYDNTKESEEAPNPIKGFIKKLIKQNDNWLSLFLTNIDFYLDEDDLINRIRQKIKDKLINENRIDDVLNSLISNLKINMYLKVKKREKFTLSFEEFYNQYRKCFEVSRTSRLPVREVDFDMPQNLINQKFIQQLLDINDITCDDIDTIIEFTTYKLKFHNNIMKWLQEGELTPDEIEKFDKESTLKWRNIFRASHRESKFMENLNTQESSTNLKKNALNCLDNVRQVGLILDETSLDSEMSNGQYYKLSDTPHIGWAHNWEEKYKK